MNSPDSPLNPPHRPEISERPVPSASPAANTPAPGSERAVAQTQKRPRMVVPDVARGLALLGIAMANLPTA